MKTLTVSLLLGSLLLGGTATATAAGDEDSRGTHTVLLEFASFTW